MRRLFKFGLAVIRDNRLLLCKPYAFDDYILPGGIREGEESVIGNLTREVREELGDQAKLDKDSLRYIGCFEDIAAGRKDTTVEIQLYVGKVDGILYPSSEIKELVWFSLSDDWALLSPIIRNKILPALAEAGYLSEDKIG